MKIKYFLSNIYQLLVLGFFFILLSCSAATPGTKMFHDEGAGPDKNVRPIPVGELNSYWRLFHLHVNEDPVAHFDFTHDRLATSFTGSYDQMSYPHEMLAGQKGDIKSGSLRDGKILIEWQPTADQDEIYSFKGEYSGLENLRLPNDRFIQAATYIGEVSSNKPGVSFKAKLQRPPYFFDLK